MKMRLLIAAFTFLIAQPTYAAGMDVRECLKQALDKPNPLYQVPEDKGPEGYSRYLVVICNKNAARDLYDSIPGPASEGDWNGRTRGTTKFLGETGGASMCYHITRDANGDDANDYNCSIRLNIDTKLMGKTQSPEMIPYPLKD